MMAAIGAARKGRKVLICEKTPRIGRKVLASGNGRCNLANENLDSSFYNPSARPLVSSVFSRFGIKDILRFFEGIGLRFRSEEGRIFPVTDQASSVLKVLEMELKRLSVRVETGFDVAVVAAGKGGTGLTVSSGSGGSIAADAVVIACGGKSYPAFGSDGSGYEIAKRLGHSIVKPVPSAVPLAAKDPLCHLLQGQKIKASVYAAARGKKIAAASGDLIFTKYGLSGTAILDISGPVSISINREGAKDVTVTADMVPFMDEHVLRAELEARLARGMPTEDVAAGILPNKLAAALSGEFKGRNPPDAAHLLKNRTFAVSGTRGWNEADFTAGGIKLDEVDPVSLESRIAPNIRFAGEMLDVDGARGGYNLAWAWASGAIAGEAV